MKRGISGLIALAVLAACLAAFAFTGEAAELQTEGNYTFYIKDGCAYVTKYTGSDSTLYLKGSLGGAPVVGLESVDGTGVFENADKLTRLLLWAPDSELRLIGENAFAGCTNLQSVPLDAGLTTIGAHAFDGCASLEYMILPAAVETVGENAFAGCYGLMALYCVAEKKPEAWAENWVGMPSVPVFFGVAPDAQPHSERHLPLIADFGTAPTCTEDGKCTVYTCSKSQHASKLYLDPLGMVEVEPDFDRTLPKTGHTPGEWQTEIEPTETEAGRDVRRCTVCGALTSKKDIPPLSAGSGEETSESSAAVSYEPISDFVFSYWENEILSLAPEAEAGTDLVPWILFAICIGAFILGAVLTAVVLGILRRAQTPKFTDTL